jgi:hypothetical protein
MRLNLHSAVRDSDTSPTFTALVAFPVVRNIENYSQRPKLTLNLVKPHFDIC